MALRSLCCHVSQQKHQNDADIFNHSIIFKLMCTEEVIMTHRQEEQCVWCIALAKVLSIVENCLVFVLITLSFHTRLGNQNIGAHFSLPETSDCRLSPIVRSYVDEEMWEASIMQLMMLWILINLWIERHGKLCWNHSLESAWSIAVIIFIVYLRRIKTSNWSWKIIECIRNNARINVWNDKLSN